MTINYNDKTIKKLSLSEASSLQTYSNSISHLKLNSISRDNKIFFDIVQKFLKISKQARGEHTKW